MQLELGYRENLRVAPYSNLAKIQGYQSIDSHKTYIDAPTKFNLSCKLIFLTN